jgi:uncharacterized protein (UPF0335 family)
MKQLIEDYKRRIAAMKIELNSNYGDQILHKDIYHTDNVDFIKKVERLTTKANEYRTFIADLERLNVQKENVHDKTVCTNGFKIPTGMLDKNNKMIHEGDILPDQTPQLISRIDFTTLRTQKKSLIEIIDEFESEIEFETEYAKKRNQDLIGILNLIDSIQDFATDVMGMNPIDIFDIGFEESREDVVKPEDVTKLTYPTDDIVKGIIERKKQGQDCTEEESAEIKGYLRELKSPSEQSIVAEIQLLFPQEYNEYLSEEDSQNGYL